MLFLFWMCFQSSKHFPLLVRGAESHPPSVRHSCRSHLWHHHENVQLTGKSHWGTRETDKRHMVCLDNCDSSVVPVGQQLPGVRVVMASSSPEAHNVYSGSKCWEHQFTDSALCVEHLALWQAQSPWSPTAVLSLWEDETRGYIQIQSSIGTIRLIADLPALRKLPVRDQGGLRIQWDWTSLCSEVEWWCAWCSPCSGVTSRS